MRLPAFAYESPGSIEDAATLLSQAGGRARALAGGTDLLPALKRREIDPVLLINLKGVDSLGTVEMTAEGAAVIGAAVGLRRLESLRNWEVLAQASSRVAAAEIRNRATVGGNILAGNRCWHGNRSHAWWRGKERCFKRGGGRCYVFPSGSRCRAAATSDLAPALIACGAEVAIRSASGSRSALLRDIYRADGARPHRIGPDELVTHLTVPKIGSRTGISFRKLAKRRSLDFALVNAAARLELEPDGRTCREAVAVVSGCVVLPTVLPLEGLRGRGVTPAIIGEAALDAVRHIGFVTPAAALDVPPSYRRSVASVLVGQCLEEAWKNAGREGAR